MHVLVVNAGSSSLRLRLLSSGDDVLADAHFEAWADADRDNIAAFVSGLDRVDAIGHRVVHGGSTLIRPTLVDAAVEAAIEGLSPLAPLHQPRALDAIRLMRDFLPSPPAVACFDTAFHATLLPEAATYAIPAEWRERWGLHRYGFHGLSHAYASRRAAELLTGAVGNPRVVTSHLGAGASLCATVNGRSIDTTMGFTPLEGLVMATRSGSVDPGLLLWLITDAGLDAGDVARQLESSSGLAALSGTSGDMRAVLERRRAGDEQAALAFAVYVHRLAAGVAAMAASLGGLDALVFTGGVGEHVPEVRRAVAARLAFLGVSVDEARNEAARGDTEITGAHARMATFVVEAREDIEIARGTREAASGDRDEQHR